MGYIVGKVEILFDAHKRSGQNILQLHFLLSCGYQLAKSINENIVQIQIGMKLKQDQKTSLGNTAKAPQVISPNS